MNIVANFEHRASSSRGKHEGESSFALCDRLGRTRDNSQRQLPTDHDYAVPTHEYQTDQSSLKLPRLLLALSSRKRKDNYKNISTDFAELTRSLHIRSMCSPSHADGSTSSGRLPYNRLLVHTDGRGMAESSSSRAAHTIDSRPFQLSENTAAANQQPDQS